MLILQDLCSSTTFSLLALADPLLSQGWPTGLGALIVKRSSAHLLTSDAYFGGGTVEGLSTSSPFWVSRRRSPNIHERLEVGTLDFLGIISLGHALDTHARLFTSHSAVSRHGSALSMLASHELSLLRHANGRPVVEQHRPRSLEPPGPTIGFSLLDAEGSHVGHVHLDRLATINGFQMRTGGLCNTGVWTTAFDFSDEDLLALHEKGRACWDDGESRMSTFGQSTDILARLQKSLTTSIGP